MAFFRRKRMEGDDMPPVPEELPPLPPAPGEEHYEPEELPSPWPSPKMRPMEMHPESLPELHTPSPMPMGADKAQVFIRLDKYRELMRTVQGMQEKMEELKATLDRIASIKAREGDIIDGWNAMLQDARHKLDDVSAKLLRPEG